MTRSNAHAPTSFRNWSSTRSLAESLALAEAGVRSTPRDPQARWLLVELLCVLAQWERALRQLQTWATLAPHLESTAQVVRGLIRAEHQRIEVLEGRREFSSVASTDSTASAWMKELWQALRSSDTDTAPPDMAARDALRRRALDQAPSTPGQLEGAPAPFEWISDADTRLGPVCELVLLGSYRWLAIDDMASLRKQAPSSLLDLLWSPVQLTLRDGAELRGFMPMRYPVREAQRDALALARETSWSELGETGVIGHGQKMWTTSFGDIPLLDLRHCRFHTGNDGAAASEGPSA
jgi:type VI secretion system protein ImpE